MMILFTKMRTAQNQTQAMCYLVGQSHYEAKCSNFIWLDKRLSSSYILAQKDLLCTTSVQV